MHCESTRVESRYGGKGGAGGASQILDDRGVTGLNYHNHSRLVLALMWTASLVLLPILVWQGHRTRQMALRLPEAESPDSGHFGTGESEISIVGLGDSVIAGIGIKVLSDSVTARVADSLAQELSTAISWRASGINGERLANLLFRLKKEPLPQADIYLVSIGVNDVTGLTPLVRWQMQVIELITLLDRRGRIVLLGVPPMQYFTALPQPLRQVLGIRAALLDKTLREVADTVERVVWLDASVNFDHRHLAQDGYHPNEVACVEMAAKIVDALMLRRGLLKP
ncbi:MAG: SGNH/GDSL hydrolase family protein [Pseudomonadales bacterium]|nr:SGNH/GDSL hydrolase family protein [Pseudomonadales bacterium]